MQCKTAKERYPNYIQLQSNRDNIAAICNVCGKVRRQNSCIERHEDRVHTSVLNIQLLLQQLTLSSQHVTVPSSAEQSIGKDAILTTTRTSQQDVSFRQQHRDNCQDNKQGK